MVGDPENGVRPQEVGSQEPKPSPSLASQFGNWKREVTPKRTARVAASDGGDGAPPVTSRSGVSSKCSKEVLGGWFDDIIPTISGADADLATRIQMADLFGSRRCLAALGLHMAGSIGLAVFAVVRAVMQGPTIWPPLSTVIPIVVLACPGSWILAWPMSMLSVHRSDETSRYLGSSALLPPAMMMQLLIRVVSEFEVVDSCSEEADFVSLVCGLFQLCLLLAASMLRLTSVVYPIPLALGVSIALGQGVGAILAPLCAPFSHHDIRVFQSVLLTPCVIVVVSSLAQAFWNVLNSLFGRSEMQRCCSERLGEAMRKLVKQNTTLLEKVHEVRDRQHTKEELPAQGEEEMLALTSRFDEIIEDMDHMWETLQQSTLSQEAMNECQATLRRIKASMLSPNLFKTVLKPKNGLPRQNSSEVLAPPRNQSIHLEMSPVRSVQQICDDTPLDVIRPRSQPESSASSSGEACLQNLLDGSLPGRVRSATSSLYGGSNHSSSKALEMFAVPETYESSVLDAPPIWEGDLFEHLPPEPPWMPSMQALSDSLLGTWHFDAVAFASLTNKQALLGAGLHFGPDLLREANLSIANDFRSLRNFLEETQGKYMDVPYHNSTHAADVLNSMMYFLAQDRCVSHTPLGVLPRLAAFVAAAIHDVGHSGRGNRYHVSRHDPIAVLYNDHSPLENMHCAIGFFILRQPFSALFAQDLGAAEGEDTLNSGGGNQGNSVDFALLRRVIVESVLATDMTKHFETIGRFKGAIGFIHQEPVPLSGSETVVIQAPSVSDSAPIFTESLADQAAKIVAIYLKAADVGHSAKSLDITKQMTFQIHREFFAQGDEERELGLPISPLCDRKQVNIGESQVGFLRYLVCPLYEAIHFFIPTDSMYNDCLMQLEANLAHWSSSNPCVVSADISPFTKYHFLRGDSTALREACDVTPSASYGTMTSPLMLGQRQNPAIDYRMEQHWLQQQQQALLALLSRLGAL